MKPHILNTACKVLYGFALHFAAASLHTVLLGQLCHQSAFNSSNIAVERRKAKSKGEKEKYKHLNAELQRIARRDIKNLPEVQETPVPFLLGEDPLEKEIATHSSALAWRMPWTAEPGGLQSGLLQRVGHD